MLTNNIDNYNIIIGKSYCISYLYNGIRYNNVRSKVIDIFTLDNTKYIKIDISDLYDKRIITISVVYCISIINYINSGDGTKYEVVDFVDDTSSEFQIPSAKCMYNLINSFDHIFNNTNPTTENVGALKSGSYVNGKSAIDILNSILFLPNPTEFDVPFTYYWGEIGSIRADYPSGITQSIWETYLKPNGSEKGLNSYINVTSILNSYEQLPTGYINKWWVIMMPLDKQYLLDKYAWYQINNYTNEYNLLSLSNEIYTGTVVLDNITYYYSAVKPTIVDAKIKYSNEIVL